MKSPKREPRRREPRPWGLGLVVVLFLGLLLPVMLPEFGIPVDVDGVAVVGLAVIAGIIAVVARH